MNGMLIYERLARRIGAELRGAESAEWDGAIRSAIEADMNEYQADLEEIVAHAMAGAVEAWKQNSEPQMEAVLVNAVRQLHPIVRGIRPSPTPLTPGAAA